MKTLSKKSMLVLSLFFLSGHAYSANDEVGGSGSVTNKTVSDNMLWTTISSVNHTVNGGAGTNDCMVVASADVDNPSPSTGKQYLFTISRNTTNPIENTRAERTLEFVDNSGVDDPNIKPVSTNEVFTGLTSTNGVAGTNLHTFYLLGKKKLEQPDGTNTAPDLSVLDYTISTVCVDRD